MSFSYPRGIRFRCLRCAICCGNTETRVRRVLLQKIEAERIANVTSKPIEEFTVEIKDHAPYIYEMRKTLEEERCVFLENRLCTIYSSRPLICRFYPFELKATRNGRHTFLFTRECPGIGEGEILTKTHFKNLFQQLILSFKRGNKIIDALVGR